MTYDWWLTPVVYAGMSVVFLEARLRRASIRGKQLIFGGSLASKALFGGGALGISILLIQMGAKSRWWENFGMCIIVVCSLLSWPKTFALDDRGIQCLWWWRPKKFIPWEEVEYVERGAAGSIEIVGTNGRVKFEGYNIDSARFCKEVTTRSNVKKIAIPSEFTGLHL